MEKLLSDQARKAMALEISSIMTGPQPRYVGDMSILPFLAQKINFEDARIASSMGVHIRRFGQNMVVYDKTDPNGKDAYHKQLEERGLLKPGETIKDLNEWIYKVAGIDKRTSDILLKV
jgi:hypothetical protein